MFSESKAAQAAAFLLKRHGGTLPVISLIKLLYLADRLALVECGQPITGDRMVAMPHGPVLSCIYDLINLGRRDNETRPWFEYVGERTNNDVSVVSSTESANLDALSPYEIRVLEATDLKFGAMHKWALVDYTHTLPEWHDPRGSSVPIAPQRILQAENVDAARIADIVIVAEEVAAFAAFGRLSE